MTMNCICETKKQKNIYRLLCVIFAVIDCLLLCLVCVIMNTETEKPTQTIEEKPRNVVLKFEEQPEVGNDILCYDPFTGHVYSCFERSDGNVQLRINPEGNYCISLLIERNDFYEMQIQKQTGRTDSDGIDTADSSLHADCNGDLSR